LAYSSAFSQKTCGVVELFGLFWFFGKKKVGRKAESIMMAIMEKKNLLKGCQK
jgi:hypothetical protein